jgi:cell shape-determining protein MreC
MVMAASMFASEAVYAQPAGIHVPVNAMFFNHSKSVSFTMRNDSKEPIQVKVGEKEMTLAPGKPQDVKLEVGDKVVAVNSTANYPAGTVLAVVSSQLSDSTVVLR